jgi:acetylornithine/N-succinyldiaminopimelate aminotransferase
LCKKNKVFLIIDEVQTGFCRTGPMFASRLPGVKIDFLTMAKGIAGGFPFGAFAVSEDIASRFEKGDHGGTYCGNPLGCAVAYAVIRYLLDNNVPSQVIQSGKLILETLNAWKTEYPDIIKDVRGKGLLIAMELSDASLATAIKEKCLDMGLIINVTHGTIIRIFPALTIKEDETKKGLVILKKVMDYIIKAS